METLAKVLYVIGLVAYALGCLCWVVINVDRLIDLISSKIEEKKRCDADTWEECVKRDVGAKAADL